MSTRIIEGPSWLVGSMTPLVTPFRAGRIDHNSYADAVERQIEAGGSGIVVTGTTGEPTSLTSEERLELVRTAVRAAAGRLPVIAATASPRLDETLSLTRAAEEAGATAVMIVAPGFVKPSTDGLIEFFLAAIGATTLPALLYNIPGRAGVTITPEVVAAVAERCPNLVGIKTASTDLEYVTELLLNHGPMFRIFCGLESYTWPMMAIGAAGVMSAVGNLLPAEVADLCAHALAGRVAEARRLHERLFRLNQALFFETNPGPLKTMLALTGLGSEEVRLPLAKPRSAITERLRSLLEKDAQLGPLLDSTREVAHDH